jgi:hypothetical protein
MAARDEDFSKSREFARNQAMRAAEFKLQIDYLNRENIHLKRRLHKIHSSWTWRIGRVVLFPYHLAIGVMDRLRAKQSHL